MVIVVVSYPPPPLPALVVVSDDPPGASAASVVEGLQAGRRNHLNGPASYLISGIGTGPLDVHIMALKSTLLLILGSPIAPFPQKTLC